MTKLVVHIHRSDSIQGTYYIANDYIGVFPKCFSLNSLNSVTKNYDIKKDSNLPHSHLLCKRPACYHSASKTHVRDWIFKLSPIHASVIYQFF